jgi:hypothetical protein
MRALLLSGALLVIIGAVVGFVFFYFRQECLVIFGLVPKPRQDAVHGKQPRDVEPGVDYEQECIDPVQQRPPKHAGDVHVGSQPAGASSRTNGASSRTNEASGLSPMIVVTSDDRSRGEVMQYAALVAASDRWAKERILGRGGAATVYRVELNRFGSVACKRFNPGSDRGADFQREIDALCQCRHPHILEIIGYANDGAENLIIMPLMEGGTLCRACPELLWARRSVIVGQLTQSVAFLHGKKIIHRDIKSSNVLLDRSLRQTRLADFGLAKDQVHSTHATTGIVVGSPGYMAPELMMRPANEKTDAYALGVVLLEILTALPAWDLGGSMALADRAVEDGQFKVDMLDSVARWPQDEAAVVAGQAVILTSFDPGRRKTATQLERDPDFCSHLRRAEAVDNPGGQGGPPVSAAIIGAPQ